jgi:hypothetical protein
VGESAQFAPVLVRRPKSQWDSRHKRVWRAHCEQGNWVNTAAHLLSPEMDLKPGS